MHMYYDNNYAVFSTSYTAWLANTAIAPFCRHSDIGETGIFVYVIPRKASTAMEIGDFSSSNNIDYGTTFFLATGFHGFHVIIGTTFIAICFLRFCRGHFTKNHHFGFEAAAWYWHFVDVVWLFLFVTIYWWGSI